MSEAGHDMRPGSPTFLHDLQFDYEPTSTGMAGTFRLTPPMMAPESGRPLLSVLATLADVFTGTPLALTRPRTVPLTVDLVLRLLSPVPPGTYGIESVIVKDGRRISVAEATITDGDTVIAHSWVTFVPFELPFEMRRDVGPRIGAHGRLERPFLDAIGVQIEAPGVASVHRDAYTMQPAGTIQGGALCGLVEAAAGSILGLPLDELDVRFLATVKQSPARATAVRLDDRTARVTVVDAGSDDQRTTAVAVVRA